eukprot:940717-Pyramimonas_sp.AAC.1
MARPRTEPSQAGRAWEASAPRRPSMKTSEPSPLPSRWPSRASGCEPCPRCLGAPDSRGACAMTIPMTASFSPRSRDPPSLRAPPRSA